MGEMQESEKKFINIFINWPDQMGVKGEDIEEDIKSFLGALVLGNYIKIDEEKFNVCDDKNVLKMQFKR